MFYKIMFLLFQFSMSSIGRLPRGDQGGLRQGPSRVRHQLQVVQQRTLLSQGRILQDDWSGLRERYGEKEY
jgi:hypothetical protein